MPRPPASKNTVLGSTGRLRIGQLLRAAREKRGISLSDATAELFPGHLSTDLLSATEEGRKFPDVQFLIAASELYGLSGFELCIEAGYVDRLFTTLTELKKRGDDVCSQYGLKLDRFSGLVPDKELNGKSLDLCDEKLKRDFHIAGHPWAKFEPEKWAVPRFTSLAIFLGTYIFRCRGEELKPESVIWFRTRWDEELVPFMDQTVNFHSLAHSTKPLPPELDWAARILTAVELDHDARGFPACELVRRWLCSISDRYVTYARHALFRNDHELHRAGRSEAEENFSVQPETELR